jgi:hypothetical protein
LIANFRRHAPCKKKPRTFVPGQGKSSINRKQLSEAPDQPASCGRFLNATKPNRDHGSLLVRHGVRQVASRQHKVGSPGSAISRKHGNIIGLLRLKPRFVRTGAFFTSN